MTIINKKAVTAPFEFAFQKETVTAFDYITA
jgi:hypothetical protein